MCVGHQKMATLLTALLLPFLLHCRRENSSSERKKEGIQSPQKVALSFTPISKATSDVSSTVDTTGVKIFPAQPLISTPLSILSTTTPVTILSLGPDSGSVGSPPKKLTLVTSTDIQSPNKKAISVTGTCTILPTISAVNQPYTAAIWDLYLSGMYCQEGQTIEISLSPAELVSLSEAKPGSGDPLLRTYTLREDEPTAILDAPPLADPVIPEILSVLPLDGQVNPIPTRVLVSVNTPIKTPLSSTLFTVSGCDSSLTGVTISESGTTLTASLSALSCKNEDVVTVTVDPSQLVALNGNIGKAVLESRHYTLHTTKPTTTIQASTMTLNSTSVLSIPVIFSGASLLEAAPVVPTPLYLISSTGTATCSLSLGDAILAQDTKATASLSLSNCQGNGALTLGLVGGILQDQVNNLSAPSNTLTFTVDTTTPTVTLTPVSSPRINPLYSSITATFSKPIKSPLSTSFLSASGSTCRPDLGTPSLSSDGRTATASLSTSGCQDGAVITVTADPNQLIDTVGNQSTTAGNVQNTYTLATVGPTVTLSEPASKILNIANPSATFTVTYASPGTISAGPSTTVQPPYSVTFTGTAKCSLTSSADPTGLGTSTVTTTISLSSCTGEGTLSLTINPGNMKDEQGNFSGSYSTATPYVVDMVAPTISSVVLNSSSTLPSFSQGVTATVTFSEAVSGSGGIIFSLVPNNPYCSPNPGLAYNVPNPISAQRMIQISGGTCPNATSATMWYNPFNVQDAAGNKGAGTTATTLATYTISYQSPTVGVAPVVTSASPRSWTISLTPATSNTTTLSADLLYKIIAYNTPTTNTATNAANGTLIADWAKFTTIGSLSPQPLVSATTGFSLPYYFAVLVKDPLTGGISYYPTANVAPVNKYLYFAPAPYTNPGVLGGIAGADTLCNSNRPSSIPSNVQIQALLVDGYKRAALTPIDWPLTPATTYYYAAQSIKVGSGGAFTCAITEAAMGTTDATGVFPDLTQLVAPIGCKDYFISMWTGLDSVWGTSGSTCSAWNSSSSFGLYGTIYWSTGGSHISFSKWTMQCSLDSTMNPPMYLLCIQK